MPTATERGLGRPSRSGSTRSVRRWTATARRCSSRPRQGRVSALRQVNDLADADRELDRRRRRRLLRRARRAGAGQRGEGRAWRPRPRGRGRRTTQFGQWLTTDLAPRAPEQGRLRPRGVRAGLAQLPRRGRSTSRRPTPGAGRSSPGSRARCRRSRPVAERRRPRHRGGRRAAGHRPGPQDPRQGGVPGLDAAARRRRGRPSWPAPTSTSRTRSARIECMIAPTSRRLDLLHAARART